MTHLFPLQLRGAGGADVEALGSYIHRMAALHKITASHLLSHAFSWYAHLHPEFRQDLPALISSGSLAVYVRPNRLTLETTRVLSSAAGNTDLRSATFLALRDALHRSMGAFSKHLRWCSSCMREFEQAGDEGYFKLIWHLEAITHCPTHGTKLADVCQSCGKHQDGYGHKSVCIHCQYCGESLARGHESEQNAESWALEGADLYGLVEEISLTPDLSYPSDGVQKVVNTLFDQAWKAHDELNFWKLIPRDECYRIETGEQPITLTIARRVSYRLGMKLTDLLAGDLNTRTEPLDSSWLEKLPSEIRPITRERSNDHDLIYRQVMQDLSKTKPHGPPPLQQVAQNCGVSVGYLSYRFPVLSKKIIKAGKKWRKQLQLKKHSEARKAAMDLFSKEPGLSRKQAFKFIYANSRLPKNIVRAEINRVFETQNFNEIANRQ